MQDRIKLGQIHVAKPLFEFIEQQVLKGLPIKSTDFWQGLSNILMSLTPANKSLLQKRKNMQLAIDDWHMKNQYDANDLTAYKAFLTSIGYLCDEVPNFSISTTNVDDEVAKLAGPQLVVPITNARFALNAVNARWGSLYDALYGTDAVSEAGGAERGTQYNPIRGERVIAYGREFLDNVIPLQRTSHSAVAKYFVKSGQLCTFHDGGTEDALENATQFVGYCGSCEDPSALLFRHNDLHIELRIDATSNIGRNDRASISDITLESALTTIMDCEDSVATVDATDKLVAYQNWLGLNKGSLSTNVTKNNKSIERKMTSDRLYTTPMGKPLRLKGRSLMFVRNVGHLMTNDLVLMGNGEEAYEGIIDAVITSLIAMHDLASDSLTKNSETGAIYIVKPKMHGPEEVAFTNELFDRVESLLSLPANTIKLGIMDEERRTSVNLKACIYQAKDRVVFINTGFLDRTGDEIHTSMKAGIVPRKADIKHTKWISAYERNNVAVGLACGFAGRAQIGKGMWPVPDNMADMLREKVGHVQSGASTAWVPSPTAATLHAIHYHQVSVSAVQHALDKETHPLQDDILTIPLANASSWTAVEVEQELDNNIQGILGYVVRWIDQGIGCSKVPDINNIGLMEDRATLRISSQHIANWLFHGVCTEEQVNASLLKMAGIVDQQNSSDSDYVPLSDDFSNSIAINAAKALIFEGAYQPSGYTEPLLHHFRRVKKAE